MGKQINFIVIKTASQGMFISDNVEGKGYFRSEIPALFFDGEKLVPSFKEGWFKLSKLPKKVEKKSAPTTINDRWELKAGFPISELTPQTISIEDWDSDSEIAGLYSYKSETVEGKLEEVTFNLEILSEEDNFYVEKPKYPGTPTLMTTITTHPALHGDRPCSLDGKKFYKIIREHIKLNINPKYARITSDYDFCLTVKKFISHDPVMYTVDIGTKRRPKIDTRYRSSREAVVFETSPEGYTNYSRQEGIYGDNQKDLDNKIIQYLNNLMEDINKPYIECTCCSGMGVILT